MNSIRYDLCKTGEINMNQLSDEELKEWAQLYIENYKNDILRTEKNLPEIPATFFSEIDEIINNLKKAHSEGKEQGTFRGIKGEKITLNLKPLFETKGHEDIITANMRYVDEPKDTIDDLTLQTYIGRLFLYSRGG